MNAAIYVRVSSDKQEAEGTSLETQEASCRAYAAAHGYAVARVYIDVHSGFELWERPALGELREAVRAREVDAVLVHALDRLSRKQVHTAILVDECERAGVALLFATEEFEKTAVGEFLRGAKAFAAELEREKFIERSQRGKRARVQSGRLMPGSRPLYGYRFRDEQRTAYDADPEAGPVVRRIYAEAAAGRTLYRISQGLMADGVPTPGGKSPVWYRRTVYNVLTDRRYTGEATGLRWHFIKGADGKRVRTKRAIEEQIPLPAGTIPALVDAETFDLVAAILRRNKETAIRNNPNPEASLLRGGFARCGVCGCNMRVANRPGHGERFELYVCNGESKDHQGPRPAIGRDRLDRAVWERVTSFLRHPEVVRHYREQLAEGDGLAEDLERLARMIADAARRRANLARNLALFEDPADAAPVVAEIAQLGKRHAALVAEREQLLARQVKQAATDETLAGIEDWCRLVGENIPRLTYEQRRTILEELGVRVKIFKRGTSPRYVMEWDPDLAIVCNTSTGATHNKPLTRLPFRLRWTDADEEQAAD